MKILEVTKHEIYFVETNHGYYRRSVKGDRDSWEKLYGESWENLYGSDDIQEALEQYLKENTHEQRSL